MCGLVGVIPGNAATVPQRRDIDKYMATLLYLDTFRGHHATGVAAIRKSTDGYTGTFLKDVVPGTTFVETTGFKKFSSNFHLCEAIIGHNRYATMGGKSKHSAHPHMSKNVLLTHNGTLTTFQDLATYPSGINDLDSARIAYEIEAKGSNAALFDKLRGAYALVWFDRRDSTVRFARNAERTLWWCVVEKNLFMYASNKWMLEAVQTIHKLTFSIYPTPFTVEDMWEVNLDEFDVEYETKDNKVFYDFKGVKHVPFVVAPPLYGQGSYHSGNYANNVVNTTNKQYGPLIKAPPAKIAGEVERSNAILSTVGLHVGQPIEILLDDCYFLTGSKKGKRRGVGFGWTASKPSVSVTLVDLKEQDLLEEAYSYNATIKAAVHKGQKDKKTVVIYAAIQSVNSISLTAAQYANVYTGNAENEAMVRELLGDDIKMPFVDNPLSAKGPNGIPLTSEAFELLVSSGCHKCSAKLKVDGPVHWTATNQPICPKCVDELGTFNAAEVGDSNFMEAV